MYGLYDPDLKSNETSRKFTLFLFASIVSFSLWSSNVLHIAFLMFSISLGVTLNAPRPSSLYNPTFLLILVGKLGQKVGADKFAGISTVKAAHCHVEI